jgi:hypothetical protein
MNMSGYTKLFSSILASTIWQESKETKIIWITMLAAANKDGVVEASLPGLAHMARLTIQEAEGALNVLSSPDPYSRTPAFEGRRIKPCDGGWQILNHDKYREQMSAAERKEYNRVKQQETRARKKARGENGPSMTVNDMSASQRHTEAKEDSKTEEVPLFSFVCPDDMETNPTVLRLYDLFNRKPSTMMDKKERKAFREAKITEDDMLAVEEWWNSSHPEWRPGEDYRKRKLLTLLNDWRGAVDTATSWKAFPPVVPAQKSQFKNF